MTTINQASELQRAREIGRKCLKQFGLTNTTSFTVKFSNRMTRSLGNCTTNRSRRSAVIKLSAPLWERATEKERVDCIYHEFAHMIANIKYNARCNHDWRWKRVMIELGQAPELYHTIDRSGLRRRQARFVNSCPGCKKEISISKAMRTRWIRGQQIRRCRTCKTSLTCQWARNAVES